MKRFGLFLILLGALTAAVAGLMNFPAPHTVTHASAPTPSAAVGFSDDEHRSSQLDVPIDAKPSEQDGLTTPAAPTPAPTSEQKEPRFSVTVVNSGGAEELDKCLDGFTHLVGFVTTEAVKPQRVFARHNNICGGDFVLAMNLGDVVAVTGEGMYRVVEARDTPRIISPEDITGMSGDILLQTCYDSEPLMRFVSLEKL